MQTSRLVLACATLILLACGREPETDAQPELTVAAAANLTGVFGEIARAFEASQNVPVVFSFAATGDLTRQIENSAPFDVFAAADIEHIDQLNKKGLLVPGTAKVYARGTLALWAPPDGRAAIKSLQDLAKPGVRFVAIAKPDIAPYGLAAVESLKALKLWSAVEPKVVYAENINMSKQYASSGNADAAFTAYSLVLHDKGSAIVVDPKLYRPIDQAMGVLKSSKHQDLARRFEDFVTNGPGVAILRRWGYEKN